jgi:energy-converting hydrogenase A subunit M
MTVESFSTLQRLKTWLRSMMTEDYQTDIIIRLSALCLINVYHKVDILDKINHIIDIFANFKNRRLEFVL